MLFLLVLDASVIPAWINAVTVVVLATITGLYAKSAHRQARAAEEQAKAATKQAEAAIKQAETAERHVAMLQAQIREQAGIAQATLKESIREVGQNAIHWLERMEKWGQLSTQSQVE